MILDRFGAGIIVEVVLNTLVAERLLLVPAVNVLRLSSSLAVLASKDFFTFILTQFVVSVLLRSFKSGKNGNSDLHLVEECCCLLLLPVTLP